MADIKITGFGDIERRIDQIHELVALISYRQKKQPEKDAMMTCLNTMQGIVEKLILAHEELAGGQTEASIEARHAMNAAQMLKFNDDAYPFIGWAFPEESDKQAFTKARPLVKKKAPAKKAAVKKRSKR